MPGRSRPSAPRRRHALLAAAALLAAGWGGAARAFGLEDVARRAQTLASEPYRKPSTSLPDEVGHLTYDQYRDIRFRPERALWRDAGLRFELTFFHQGWTYPEPVALHEIGPDGVRDLAFDPDAFDYGHNAVDRNRLRGLSFAGFRVFYPLNPPHDRALDRPRDEALSFVGASYFRALGRGQRYGASARGLAVDTALPSGEEFPRFVEFWIERPAPAARTLTVYALLDGPRVAGAYRFVLTPGVTTVIEVRAVLYARAAVGKLGVAPVTSMFFFGANQRSVAEDYRPEVHDSDGLLVHSGSGEWIWRPLVNPKRLLVTSFALTSPRGFGLAQRERRFARYEDLEARYDLRPSVWVEPTGDWGTGRVELVELPVPSEMNDNVVAYWVPEGAPRPGERVEYGYRLRWEGERQTRPPHAWVAQTRRGFGFAPPGGDIVELHVDLAGPALGRRPVVAVEAVVSTDANGEIVERHDERNEATGGWRVVIRVRRRDAAKPIELRASLRDGMRTMSETWSYILPPD
jgi:glucans biosynthesis protein